MKVALVHHETRNVVNQTTDAVIESHTGTVPSVALLYVASVLEELDVEILYIDTQAMAISWDEAGRRMSEFGPDIVGITAYTSHFHDSRRFCRFAKKIVPDAKVMVGGIHAQIYPEDTLKYASEIDFAVTGEAEMVLPKFVECYRLNKSFEEVLGLVWRRNGEVVNNGPAPLNKELDKVPFPARHLVPNEKYFNLISRRSNYTAFNSSRGCPFACTFCEGAQTKWRWRSAKNIADEFEECYEKHGIREIDIYDSSFTIRKDRVHDICNELISRGLHKKVVWAARSRVDCIDRDLLKSMKAAGCYRIFYGIESGVPKILEALRKKANVEQIEEVITMTKEEGISPFGYFLLGSPHETPETCRQTMDFTKKLPFDFVSFNALTPMPQTQLYRDHYISNVDHDYWEDYISSPDVPAGHVGRPWLKDLDDDTIKKLCMQAMMEFYFRPSQIIRVLSVVGKDFRWEHFVRYSRVAMAMVGSALGRIRSSSNRKKSSQDIHFGIAE